MKKRWSFQEAEYLFNQPFISLLYKAQSIHRDNFDPNTLQISTLLSIKTGGCSENCFYCSQSTHYHTSVKKQPLMQIDEVIEAAKRAKKNGSTRFCMGAAWGRPRDQDLKHVCAMVREVKKLGLETCVTLGFLREDQALMLKKSGLDFYNHNVDSSKEFYKKIVTTHCFADIIKTLEHVRKAGIKLCCGGILGMGEMNSDRIKMLLFLANLNKQPESVPINRLIKIPGTPLENEPEIDPFDLVRTIAVARILMPKSHIRLAAGRENMSDEMVTLCFFAGVNSLFCGEVLLTAPNSVSQKDNNLFQRLGLKKSQ